MSTDKLPLSVIFSRRLTEARKTHEFRKIDMAKLIGVTPQVYQRYEEGRIPAADILLKMAEAVKRPVDWLLGLDVSTELDQKIRSDHVKGLLNPANNYLYEAQRVFDSSDRDETTAGWLAMIMNALWSVVSRNAIGSERETIIRVLDKLIEKYK